MKECVTIQDSPKHKLLRAYDSDLGVQNPIGEADFKWILQRNCEGTEQLRYLCLILEYLYRKVNVFGHILQHIYGINTSFTIFFLRSFWVRNTCSFSALFSGTQALFVW